MNELKQCCEKELDTLKMLRSRSEEVLKGSPEGSLRVSRSNNFYHYYWKMGKEDTDGKYIKKSNRILIEALAQKDYAIQVLKMVDKKEKSLRKFIRTYLQMDVDAFHENVSDARKKLIKPFYFTGDEITNQWRIQKDIQLKQSSIQNKYELSDESGILTESRELVRSKTEKIIADKLNMMGIPYVYEVPIWLMPKGSYVYPDFTVLNVSERKEFYWEHFGMMEKEEYCQKALKKLEDYAKAGIYPGKKLIVTYETSNHPLNIDVIEGVIMAYLQ